MNKWLKGATALILALSFNVGADVANGQDKKDEFGTGWLNIDNPAPAPARQTTRPTPQYSSDDESPREKAETFWRAMTVKNEGAEAAPVGKRYLVCFLGTTHYDYKSQESYPEGLKDEMIGSYCVAALSLIGCRFDEMITISDEYFNKKQIDAVFDILNQKTSENDEIFIYWNGHGGQCVSSDENGNIVARYDCEPKDEADGIDEYLVLYETKGAPYTSLDEFRNYAMVDDDLAKNFKKLDGRRVMAFFEVCHAAGLANPEQIETARNPSGSRGVLGEDDNAAPSFPCCTTWKTLKLQADSTAELLSVRTATNALRFEEVDDSWEQRGSRNLGRTAERETSRASNVAAPDSSALELWETLRQSGAKSAKAGGERASYDLTLDTVKEMAVAFTCLEEETATAGLWDIQDGVLGQRVVNPGAFAVYLAACDAFAAKRRLTFGDFRKVLNNVIMTHNELEREICRRYPDETGTMRGLQTPAYLSNANGLIIYDPERDGANAGN